MKKVLLVGVFDDELNGYYKSLLGDYQVQLCKIDCSEVDTMVKMTTPDLIVIRAQMTKTSEIKILEYLQKIEHRVSVLYIGNTKDCEIYAANYDDFFSFVEESTIQNDLLSRCNDILGYEDCCVHSGQKKILIVDDSGVFLRSIKAILEPHYEVLLAKTGKKALNIAEQEQPDLILLDYEMPGWNGKETLEKLRSRKRTANIPIIFLTALNDKPHIIEVLKMQPQGYILKPVNSEELKEKIVEVIGW